jgi:hypothetical protein
MSEYKRTVFSDLEISHLSESPAALDCLVRYHEERVYHPQRIEAPG